MKQIQINWMHVHLIIIISNIQMWFRFSMRIISKDEFYDYKSLINDELDIDDELDDMGADFSPTWLYDLFLINWLHSAYQGAYGAIII